LREKTLKEFDIKNHIEVVYNFVNCDVYVRDVGAAKRREEYASPNERVLVHLSNFRPVKRITDVWRSSTGSQEKCRRSCCWSAMDRIVPRPSGWPCRRAFTDHVIFLGKQDRVQEKLAISDVIAVASELESVRPGRTRGDGLQGGSIATRVGGIPEVIEHGKSGYMAEVGTSTPWLNTPSNCSATRRT